MTRQQVEQLVHDTVKDVISSAMQAGADLGTFDIHMAVCAARERAIERVRALFKVAA